MRQEIYGNDENGNTVLLNVIEIPDQVFPPDWIGLTNGLYSSITFNTAISTPGTLDPIIYTTLLKVLTDGENGSPNATEDVLLKFLSMSMTYNDVQKTEINTILTNCNFKIQLT